jgi:hypothetical protein
MHGGARGCPRALNGRPGTAGLLTPDGLGSKRESHLLAMPGGWQGSRCPDRNLDRYAGTRPVHQAASVTRVRQRRETSPIPARSVRSSSQSIKSSANATLWVAPELSDPVGSLEVGQHEDVEQLGERGRARPLRAEPTLANHHPRVRCRCHPSIRCPAHRVRVLASVCSRPGLFR